MQRVAALADSGASLEDCVVIEIYAGTARVTAALRQLGMKSSFGVDKLRSKNVMTTVIIADLCTPEGEELLMSWLKMLGLLLKEGYKPYSKERKNFGITKINSL